MSVNWKKVDAPFDPNSIRQYGTKIGLLEDPSRKIKKGEHTTALHGTVPIDSDGDGVEDQRITVAQRCDAKLTWDEGVRTRGVELDRWGNPHIVTGRRNEADEFSTVVDEAQGVKQEVRNVTHSNGIRFRERIEVEARDLTSGKGHNVASFRETDKIRDGNLELPLSFECTLTQGVEVFVGHFNRLSGGEQIAIVNPDGTVSVYEWAESSSVKSLGSVYSGLRLRMMKTTK